MSKPVEEAREEIPEETTIQIFKERGKIIDGYSRSEQFKEMFYNFYNMFDSSELIKEEYDYILKRARVMDEIVRLSDLN